MTEVIYSTWLNDDPGFKKIFSVDWERERDFGTYPGISIMRTRDFICRQGLFPWAQYTKIRFKKLGEIESFNRNNVLNFFSRLI